jgi:rSAM/selenodomain-associated transferase 2
LIKSHTISVIIPCLNEADNLKELIPYLQKHGEELLLEIIIVDGGSKDNSISVAHSFGVKLIQSQISSRATQLNLGAQHAKGNVLYFVHADTRPAKKYSSVILESLSSGKEVGCFRYRFDSDSKLLKFNSWFTQFNGIFSGGGDQSLFIKKSLFSTIGGFDESFCIMEDFEMVRIIRQKTDFHVLAAEMTVSSRKYSENGWLKVQLSNLVVFTLFLLKVKPASIKSLYLNFLK